MSYLDMRRLTYVSNTVKRPINRIIKEAVVAYTTAMLAEISDEAADGSVSEMPEQPASQPPIAPA